MTVKHNPEVCGRCKWHIFDELEGEGVCVNRDSDYWLSYTENNEQCELWAKKPTIGGKI